MIHHKAKSRIVLMLLGALIATSAHAGAVRKDQGEEWVPSGKGWGETVFPGSWSASGRHGPSNGAGGAGSGTTGISYHGGPLISSGPVKVYLVWYGSWPSNNTGASNSADAIVNDFVANLTGTSTAPRWYGIVSGSGNGTIQGYYDTTSGTQITAPYAVTLADTNKYVNNYCPIGPCTAGYTQSLTDADIFPIIKQAYGTTTLDPNGVYFVLSSKDVNETSGLCTKYCAWHGSTKWGAADTSPSTSTKYAFVGNPDRCPSGCAAQTTSPNGNAGADGMVNLIAHELAEAVTDPNGTAWWDARGRENADKCAWTWGKYYATATGAFYNLTVNSKQYLVQRNWVNASGGYCANGI